LACSVVSLDAMDVSGEQHLDVVSTITIFRILCVTLGLTSRIM
jgi:coenzyme F420-reducing hydrogenase delta subunit